MIEVICGNCGKKFEIENKYFNRSKTKNFYCSKKCSCEKNNSVSNILIKQSDENFKYIVVSSKSLREICFKLGYNSVSGHITNAVKKRCAELNIECPIDKKTKGERIIKSRTKGDVLKLMNTYQGYRSAVRKDAEKTFEEEDGNYKCCICGYDKHIEIAHIKAVSEFCSDTLISEINDINNIVPLCPNHHWEYDNGMMDEKNKKILKDYIEKRKN